MGRVQKGKNQCKVVPKEEGGREANVPRQKESSTYPVLKAREIAGGKSDVKSDVGVTEKRGR